MVWGAGMLALNVWLPGSSGLSDTDACATRYGILAMHVLMAAYFSHLLARTVYLTVDWCKKRFHAIVADMES